MAKSELPSDRTPLGSSGGPSRGPAPTDRSDRARLEQIQTTDITESRVNQDFLHWLKTRGLNYAAILLLALVAVMGFNLFKERRASERDAAWIDLAGASIPATLEDVAQRHGSTDSIASWALLDAADRNFGAAQRGVRMFDREPDAEDFRLSPEQQQEWMAEADRLYAKVADTARNAGNFQRRGFLVAALFGRAAVAESRGDASAARGFLTEVIDATRESHPAIAEIAERRVAGLDPIASAQPLPSRADLPTTGSDLQLSEPIVTDDLLRDLLTPSAPRREPEGTDGPAASPPAADQSGASNPDRSE